MNRHDLRPQPDFIHEFVAGKSKCTLLLLHGTGGNERDLIPLGQELDPNASLLSPRGNVLENGMPRFFRRLAEGVFDLEDLRKQTNQLADFVIAAAKHYEIDNKRIVAVGYSNGANMAACNRDPDCKHPLLTCFLERRDAVRLLAQAPGTLIQNFGG